MTYSCLFLHYGHSSKCQMFTVIKCYFETGACPDWNIRNKLDAYRHVAEAMKMAEDWLNVTQVG